MRGRSTRVHSRRSENPMCPPADDQDIPHRRATIVRRVAWALAGILSGVIGVVALQFAGLDGSGSAGAADDTVPINCNGGAPAGGTLDKEHSNTTSNKPVTGFVCN